MLKKCPYLENNYILTYDIIQIYSGITSGRVLDGELLYTNILEVNLFAFAHSFMKISLPSTGRCMILNLIPALYIYIH